MVFGKLPAHGDFVARGVTSDIQAAIDDWLIEQMARARAVHGASFERHFDHAPVWRFTWAQPPLAWTDALPPCSLSGALSPSTDRIGRRFPIIAAIIGGGEQAAFACEDRLYAALVEQWNVDDLHTALGTIPADADDAPARSRWWTDGNDDFEPATLEGERPVDLIAMMLTPIGEPSWA